MCARARMRASVCSSLITLDTDATILNSASLPVSFSIPFTPPSSTDSLPIHEIPTERLLPGVRQRRGRAHLLRCGVLVWVHEHAACACAGVGGDGIADIC